MPKSASVTNRPAANTAGAPLEWCDRRLLARIHRYTISRMRSEIEVVTAADFMNFLLHWQHLAEGERMKGPEGTAAVIEQLDGFELAAGAWEQDVLAGRVEDYGPEHLDLLCLSGRVAWGRMTPPGQARSPLKSSPMALILRPHVSVWRSAAADNALEPGSEARVVHDLLARRGASFFDELASASGLLRTQVERALGELAGMGLVTADSFSGLRALLAPPDKRRSLNSRGRKTAACGVDTAGRWSLLESAGGVEPEDEPARVEKIVRALLKRYGILFRALLARESRLPPWRDLALVCRRLEARGEIRGGRFVKGFGGEQFALPEAVGRLRAIRKQDKTGALVAISAADPLNLVGVLTPEARVPAITGNRVLFRDGVPIAALEGGEVRRLAATDLSDDTLRTLFWRRSGTDIKLRIPALAQARVSQRLMHGGAAIRAKPAPVRH